MEKTITLNETQIKLLKEYMDASADRSEKHKLLVAAATGTADMENYNLASKAYARALELEDSTARVFASCVAAELKG